MPSLLPRRFRGARIPLALTTLCAIAGAAPATWAAPCDPNSSIIYSPAQNTFGTVLFEDSWPSKGDLDFNDEVTAYNYEFQRDSSGNVVTIKATFSILAAGALNHNDLFLHLPTPRTLGSPTIVDQFGHVIAPIASETELVFPILADTRSAFGAAAGAFVNTDPTAAGTTGINLSFTISFASGVPLATAQQPFDLFIARTGNFGWQIHLPQYAGTNGMNTSRFNTVDDASTPGRHFVTSAGLPFGLVIPDQILWPKEFTQISAVYPDISIFAASGGAAATDWYTSTVNTSNAYTNGAGNQAPPSPQMTGADLSCTTISYASSSLICQVGTACSLAAPTHSGGATTFSISPALPGGLTFNTSTGAISGTPGATSPSGSYTVTGINGAGAATAVLTVEIDAAPAGNTFAPSLAMGSGDACAILNGNVYCWGQNYYGALGNGGPASATPTQVAGLPGPAQSVSLGYYSSCAVVNGAAWCWGYTITPSLTSIAAPTPAQIAGLGSGVTAVSGGGFHFCAIQSGGAVCWGTNNEGQVGNGTISDDPTYPPTAVIGLSSGVTSIATSGYTSCAVQNGAVKCWGYGGAGERGDSTLNPLTGDSTLQRTGTPQQVTGLTSGVLQVTGYDSHFCALLSTGAVKCWGEYFVGNNGYSLASHPLAVPTQISGVSSALAIASGVSHDCAVFSSGVKCWGMNYAGELGNNTTTGTSAPVSAAGITSGVKAIAGGEYYNTCAIVNSGLQCWGNPLDPNATAPILVPTTYPGLSGF